MGADRPGDESTFEKHAIRSQPVHVGRLNCFVAVAAKVRGQVLGDKPENVGFCRRRGRVSGVKCGQRCCEQANESNEGSFQGFDSLIELFSKRTVAVLLSVTGSNRCIPGAHTMWLSRTTAFCTSCNIMAGFGKPVISLPVMSRL
jgi:hypothetical protein